MFSIPQRTIRDLRQVVTSTFGRDRPTRPRQVSVTGQDSTLTLTITEGPTSLKYQVDDTDCGPVNCEFSLADLRPFESSAVTPVHFSGDPAAGQLIVGTRIDGTINFEQAVSVATDVPHAPNEAAANDGATGDGISASSEGAMPKVFQQRWPKRLALPIHVLVARRSGASA